MEDSRRSGCRLWRGEVVVGHDGPAGKWPVLALDPEFDEQISLLLSAFGPESLKLAGRAFDGTCCTRSPPGRPCAGARTRGDEAERGSRPCLRSHLEPLRGRGRLASSAVRPKKTVGRMATYLQAYGDLDGAHQRLGSGGARSALLRSVRRRPGCWSTTSAPPPSSSTCCRLILGEWLSAAGLGSPTSVLLSAARWTWAPTA